MMESTSYKSIFSNPGDEYKPSFLRDTTRLHLFNNYLSTEQSSINERDDAYQGFYSSFYQEQIEERYKDLNREDLYLATRTTVLENANYDITNNLLSSTGGLTKRIFSAFNVSQLFSTEEEDNQFSKQLVQDFSEFLVKPRSEREITGTNLLPDLQQLQKIDSGIDYFINKGIVDSVSNSSQLRQDIQAFQQRTYNSASEIDIVTNGGLRQSRKLLDNVTYSSRPGILPAIGIMHDSTNEVSIDIFQYQNESIIDYTITNLLERARDYAEGVKAGQDPERFTFNLRLAYNKEAAHDSKGYDILGPNFIAIRKLQRLQELYGQDGSIGHLLNINISLSDRRNHPKFMLNDSESIIGSQNLTNPVGKSIYQQGSNFETLRVLHFKHDTYTSNTLEKALEDHLVNRDDLDAETLMYMQSRSVMNRINKNPDKKFLSTGQKNIAGPIETMDLLTKTIRYIDSKEGRQNNAKISTILDQVFLLQHETDLYNGRNGMIKGEMGEESTHTFSTNEAFIKNKADNYRRKVQSPFIDMIIEGRATAIVDVRNYKENIQDPIFEKLTKSGLLGSIDYNLNNLIERTGANSGSAQDRRNALMPELSKFGLDESMATQILSMTSGNIQTASVPRQHVKAFLAYEDGKLLSGSMGSSNFGLYSLGYDDSVLDKSLTNFEMNLVYADDSIRNQGNGFLKKNYLNDFESVFATNRNQETQELQNYASHYNSMVSNISSKKIGQLQYTDVDNRAEYERNVDRSKLMDLYSNLKSLSEKTNSPDLIKLGLEYDSKGPIALQVKINNQLTYKFTALTSGSGDRPGFIYEINKSKAIGESDFTNNSKNHILMGFERDGRKASISPGRRLTMTPIETTMGLISSVALEVEQIKLIRAPLIEYQHRYAAGLEGNTDFTTGVAKYLLQLSSNKGRNIHEILDPTKTLSNDIILGALKHLQIKLRNPDATARNIHSLVGIENTSESRIANINRLTELIQIFGTSKSSDRNALLTGKDLPNMDSVYGFMSTLLNNPQYADLLHDFISAQDDPLYRKSLDKLTKEVSNRAYDPYLLRTQVNNYSSTQALRQKPLYGINERRNRFGQIITAAANNDTEGLMSLTAFAFTNSPYEFNGTDDLGKGKDIIFTGVADSGGSREKTILDSYSYTKYNNLQDYYSHSKIGITTSFSLLTDAGVGFNVNVDEQDDYRESIRKVVGDELATQIYSNTLSTIRGSNNRSNVLLFNFDTSKKASQIPQRIKNVKGSRPLNEVTEVYQDIVDNINNPSFKPLYHNRFGLTGSSEVRTVGDLQSNYLSDLRSGLDPSKAHLLGNEFSIGALYGNRIKTTLSTDLVVELEAIRKQIVSTFNVDTSTGVGAELLRSYLVHLDTQSSGLRGFTGSSKRTGHSVMLFQLSGAYSDYSYVNPYYGGEKGVKVGFVDRTVKGHQASKLLDTTLIDGDSSGWSLDKNNLTTSGQINAFDSESGETYSYQFNSESGEYEKSGVVNSRREFSLMNNLLDKVGASPSVTGLNATSNAASFTGETPREVLREVRMLDGNPDSNEIRQEILFDRLYSQTTRRQESQSGGLLKLNPINDYGDFFNKLHSHFTNNLGGSFRGSNISVDQIRGIANPSNFKSYMYEHGATILTDRQLTKNLLGNDARKLAASLLMAFGTERFGNNAIGNDILNTLGELAGAGALGDYFKDLHTTTLLTKSIKNSIEGKGRASEIDIATEFIKGTTVSSQRDKAFKNLQVRTLSLISLEEIQAVLKGGDETSFINKLTLLLSDPTGKVLGGEYLDIGKDRGRELALLAGSLDMFAQLSQTNATDIKTLNATKNLSALYSLGTIGGLTAEELEQRQEELGYLINSFSAKTYVLGTYISSSSSSSKVALSSKKQSFIENQHLAWTPFYTNIEKFERGATVDQLRGFLSTIFGAMSGGFAGEFIDATQNLEKLDILSPYVRGAVFKAKSIGTMYSPLITDKEFTKYKNSYEVFGVLSSLISQDNFYLNSENRTLLKNIVQVYSKKGWDNTGVESTFTLLNNYLSKETNTNITILRDIVSQGYSTSISKFNEIYDNFRLHQDKGPGTTPNEAKSSGMHRSAGKLGRFSMDIPVLEFTGDGTVRYYKNLKQTGISLAGEDLKMLGESYGGFEPELVKTQITIWEGLNPNSNVSKFFDLIAAANGDVGDIKVNNNTLKELIQFQEAFTLFPYMLGQEAGAVATKMFGNKVGFDGGTTTPAAMFLGGSRAQVLPKTLIDTQINVDKAAKNRIKDLGLNTKGIEITKGFLQNTIDSINDYAEDRLRTLQREYPAALVKGTEDRLNLLFSALNHLSDQVQNSSKGQLLNIKEQIKDTIYKFEVELSINKFQTNRPSPMGNPLLGSDKPDNFNLKDADNLLEDQGLDIRLNPIEGENKNSTLHLRNPFSLHQTQGADFDGDQVINIRDTSDSFKIKVAGRQNLIKAVEEQNAFLTLQASDFAITGKNNPNTINKKIEENNKKISRWQSDIIKYNEMTHRVESNSDYENYTLEAAKFIGKYSKVDYRFFVSQEKGGWATKDIDPSVLFTYMEQGRGLFGGIENIFTNESSQKHLFDTFTALAQQEDKLNSASWLDGFHAQNDIQSNIHNILRQDSNLSDEVRRGLVKSIDNQRSIGLEGNAAVSAGVSEYLAKTYAAKTGTDTLHKFNAKGIMGAAMGEDTFESMNKTLAEAGSVILGKTYNTMVGMLFTETPALAISYAVLNDPDGRFQGIVESVYGDRAASKLQEMRSDAMAVRAKSEDMGAFLQVTQQILRDSIKPKQGEQYLKDLDDALEKYHSLGPNDSKVEIDKAREGLVKAFGPGSGLKALMQLESLTSDLHGLLNTDNSEHNLFTQSELLKKYEIDSVKEKELSERLGFNEKTGLFEGDETKELNKLGLSKNIILASYKTKQDLISIVGAFSFEKGSNISISFDEEKNKFKIDRGGSTGNSLVEQFTKGLNYVDATTKDSWEGLVKGVEEHINNNGRTQLTESQAAYLDHIKDLGYREELSGSEKYGWSGLKAEEKLYQAHVYLETKGQLTPTAGLFGEGLVKMAEFNQARRKQYGNTEDRTTATSFDIAQDPLVITGMMAMASGKLSPEMVGKTMKTIVNAARNVTGKLDITEEDAVNLMLQGTSLNETPSDTRLKGAFVELGKSQSGKEAYQYLLDTARSVSFGTATDSVKSFVNSGAFQNYQGNGSEETLVKHFKKEGFTHEDSLRLAKDLSTIYAKGIIDPDATVNEMARAAINKEARVPTGGKTVGRILGGLGSNADAKSNFLFPILGLIGQAIATGDLTADMLQQTAGNALSAIGYMRMSTVENGWGETGVQGLANMTAGTGFKLRLAMEENGGDAGKALIQTASRELTIGLVSHMTNPIITKTLEKALGGEDHLDFKKFESSRSVISNVLGQMTATVIGMITGNFVSKAAVQLPEISSNLIEAGIRASQQARSQYGTIKDDPTEDDLLLGDNDSVVDYITQNGWANDLEYDKNMLNAEDLSSDEYTYNFSSREADFYAIHFNRSEREEEEKLRL